MATATNRRKKSKLDLATAGGLLLALSGILGGLIMEGGQLSDVAQVTAAIIVLGGTLGAVMVTTPMPVLQGAVRKLKWVFFDQSQPPGEVIEEVLWYASKARKSSIVSLEGDLENVSDPFLKKALALAVDGADLHEIRKMLELELAIEEKNGDAEVKVYEAAGGYAPTVGIIGAVLGLIQVMKNLANIDEVGHGIAVAFVATVYGVAAANLFFLPAANKIRSRLHQNLETKELILEGVTSIVEGLNPRLIQTKLDAYTQEIRGTAGTPRTARAAGAVSAEA